MDKEEILILKSEVYDLIEQHGVLQFKAKEVTAEIQRKSVEIKRLSSENEQ